MLEGIAKALEKLQVWCESCDCHWSLLADCHPPEALRKEALRCPWRARRAPGLANGPRSKLPTWVSSPLVYSPLSASVSGTITTKS